MTNLDSILNSRDITLPTEVPSNRGYGFSSGHVWMWELDYKESWAVKNWCFWTVMFEKTLESPLDRKETQPVHAERDQFWVFIGKTSIEVETAVLWPPDARSVISRLRRFPGEQNSDSLQYFSLEKPHSPWEPQKSDTT